VNRDHADATLEADGVTYDINLAELSQRGGTLSQGLASEIQEQDARARKNLTPPTDIPDGFTDFCIPEGYRPPSVPCALCPAEAPGRDLPPGWDWLPDARVCCPDCAHSDAANIIRLDAHRRRKRR
jgi:hypothetical protein